EVGVERGEVVDAAGEALLGAAVEAGDHPRDVVAVEEGVVPVVIVAAGRRCLAVRIGHGVNLPEDADVVRDVEGVARVLVGEQIVEIVEARPGDAAETERAWLVRGEEQAVLGVRPALRGQLEEAFDGMDLAMPERIGGFMVGLGDDQRKIGLAQDCGAEDLVAFADALAAQRRQIELDHVEQTVEQRGRIGHRLNVNRVEPSAANRVRLLPSTCQRALWLRASWKACSCWSTAAAQAFLVEMAAPKRTVSRSICAWANHELQPPEPPARRSSPMVSVGTVRGRTAAPPIEVACQTESRMAGAVGAVGWTLELAPVWVEPTRLVTMTTGWAGASGLTG